MEAIKPVIMEVVSVYKAKQCTIVVKRIENGARVIANNRSLTSRIEIMNKQLSNLYLAHKESGRVCFQKEITMDELRRVLGVN